MFPYPASRNIHMNPQERGLRQGLHSRPFNQTASPGTDTEQGHPNIGQKAQDCNV